jgi:transposase
MASTTGTDRPSRAVTGRRRSSAQRPAWQVGQVIGGVDTHSRTHHAAVVDHLGRHLGDREFPATPNGYRDLLVWVATHGDLAAVGVEGTGSFGAELARGLAAAGVLIFDVDRPDRAARRRHGKSDPLDAYAAAEAVAAGRATPPRRPAPQTSKPSACCG